MGTHYAGTAAEVAALDAYIKLIRATDSIIARIQRRTAQQGLTLSQFGVLEALWHLGPLCQRELGAKLLKSGGNITLIIDNLEKRALVERKRDRDDRRFVTVHLTEAGAALIREVLPGHVEAIAAEMSALSREELGELERLCRRLGRVDAPPAGLVQHK